MKPHASLKFLVVAAALMLNLAACNQSTTTTSTEDKDSAAVNADAAATLADAADSPQSEEVEGPAPKPEAAINDLKQHWEAAIAAEKKFLGNPSLEKMVYDVGAAIPLLVDLYRTQKPQDDLILSTFIEMMEARKDAAWIKSETRAGVSEWGQWMSLTPVNADKVIHYAEGYAVSGG